MAVKLQAKPMQAILQRLNDTGLFEIISFPEDMILNSPVESWPKVQGLISFFSNGFPLDKAIKYAELVKPIELNRLESQRKLRNRADVYETLKAYEVPVPKFTVIDHLIEGDAVDEHADYIEYKGIRISKPFVEKPIDADNHNIHIYYPVTGVGGGVKRLIRKIDDKSAEFYPEATLIRRDGVYLYEPFLPTQGMDVKVYMVGTCYSHAEARKAPTVDGKVQRSADGKEVRYPITLTETEKACGALIVKAFKQHICGFDVLRTNGGSLVCDVNGFSFVKGNRRYYDDCAFLVSKFFTDTLSTKQVITNLPLGSPGAPSSESEREPDGDDMRLRSVIVVMRHGDRKPKEKLKFKSSLPIFTDYLMNSSVSEVLLKSPDELGSLLTSLRSLLKAEALSPDNYEDVRSLQLVLEIRDSFSGLNRKVQIKRMHAEVLVVAKWGGELTGLGRKQAENLGRTLRVNLFPEEDSLLRLHASFRHDFKIYSSQEGRCQLTAAAFTKGFLDLDGDLAPILVSLVANDAFAHELLDHPVPKSDRDKVKEEISDILHSQDDKNKLADEQTSHALQKAAQGIICRGPPIRSLEQIWFHSFEFCRALREEISRLSGSWCPQRRRQGPGPRIPAELDDEKEIKRLHLVRIEHRWAKIVSGFGGKNRNREGGSRTGSDSEKHDCYDTSKIPDLWDSAIYDLVHHKKELQFTENAGNILQNQLLPALMPVHTWVSGSEYGISAEDKKRIGAEISWRLLQKIMNDVEYMREEHKCEDSSSKGSPSAVPLSPSGTNLVTVLSSPNMTASHSLVSLPSFGNLSSRPMTPKVSAKKTSKVPPELRSLMRQAMRDGSDWHPKLLSTVAKVTGMRAEDRPVRSRVYVTSSSTMHALLNVLSSSDVVVGSDRLKDVADLNYLSHIVIRCFEDPQARKAASPHGDQLAWYTIELALSPGIVSPENQEPACAVSIGPQGLGCSLEDLDAHLSEVLADNGHFSAPL